MGAPFNINYMFILRFSVILCIFTQVSTLSASPDKTKIMPSFDCNRAKTEVEHMLCSSDELALLDLILNDVYNEALNLPDSADIRNTQRSWLKEKRNKSCIQRNMAKKELLAECYRNRISDLYRKIGFPADIKDKYVNLLLSADSQDTPSSPNEFLELFLDKTNTRSKVDRLFGDCNEVHVYKSFWDGKHLITNEHTSAVECTGRSVHYFYNHTYCLNNNKFIATDTFFGCPKPYKKMEIISHGKAYLESNFSALVGSNTTKDSLLRKILETVKESKNPYLSGSWIYSETSMKYVLENTELLSELIQGYDDAVIGIINDLLKVHNSITSQSGWERNFNSYRPYKPNNYMDNAYNNISEGFPSTPDIQRGRVIANVHYTYQELYFRFWYKTYQQHSMTLAHKAMTKLKQELITRKE